MADSGVYFSGQKGRSMMMVAPLETDTDTATLTPESLIELADSGIKASRFRSELKREAKHGDTSGFVGLARQAGTFHRAYERRNLARLGARAVCEALRLQSRAIQRDGAKLLQGIIESN